MNGVVVMPVTGLNIDLSLDVSAGTVDALATAADQVDGFGGTVKGINLLVGTNKADTFIAADGIETKLYGDIDDDVLTGGSVADLIIAGAGMDLIDGADGADTIEGQAGADHISGGAGEDAIAGGDGNDYIDGGADNDILLGGAGDDIILGGAGADSLVGGQGDDTYLYTGDWGQDVDTITVISATKPTSATDDTQVNLPLTSDPLSAPTLLHGKINIDADGSYTYTPTAAASNYPIGHTFTDTFTITVENDSGFTEEITKTITLVNGGITVNEGDVGIDPLPLTEMTPRLVLNGQLPLSDWLSGDVTISGFGNSLSLTPGTAATDIAAAANPQSINFDSGELFLFDDGSYYFNVSAPERLDATTDAPIDAKVKLLLSNGPDTKTVTVNLTFTADAGDGLVIVDGDNVAKNGAALMVDVDGGLTQNTNIATRGVIEAEQAGDDTLSFAGLDPVAATADHLAIAAVDAVTNNLDLTFNAGALSVSDSAATANTIQIGSGSLENIELIKGGQGSNNYTFEDLWGGKQDSLITLDDAANDNMAGNGTLDFSTVTSDLVFTIEKQTDDQGALTGKVEVTVTTTVEVTSTKVLRIGKSSLGSEFLITDDDTETVVYRTENREITETVTHTVIATDIESLIGGAGENRFVFVDDVEFAGDIDGSAGTSTLDYSQYGTAVMVDLSAVGTATGVAGTVSQMNNIIGSDFADTLTGDAYVNMIDGRGEGDTIDGGAGNDELIGGDGNDTIMGGDGNDTLDGGLGNDILQGGNDDDTYIVDDTWADRNTLIETAKPTQTETITDTDGNNTLDLSGLTADLKFTFTNNTGGTQLDIKADVTYKNHR